MNPNIILLPLMIIAIGMCVIIMREGDDDPYGCETSFRRFGEKICDASTGGMPGFSEIRYNRQTGQLMRVMQSWISDCDGAVSYSPITKQDLNQMITEREEKLGHLNNDYATIPHEFVSKAERELNLLLEAQNYTASYIKKEMKVDE